MKIKGKLTPGILVLLVAFLIFILLTHIANPGMLYHYGLSYGLRLQLPFSPSGRLLRETLTRKNLYLGSGMFYAAEGDQGTLKREVNLQEGYLYTSLWKNRQWPPDEVVWGEIIEISTSDKIVTKIKESGFYHFYFKAEKFDGGFEFAW